MPVMDGLESTQAIRDFFIHDANLSIDKHPIIIGVTGHVEEKFKQEGIQSGMDDVQSKPLYLKQMKAVLAKYYNWNYNVWFIIF